jgi:hypothetical protein
MNSLQLISKIKTKAADLQAAINEIFSKGNELSQIDKDLLKAHTTAFYDLILKLQCNSSETITEETKSHIANAVLEPTVIAQTQPDEVILTDESPVTSELPQAFNHVVSMANDDEVSLNKVEDLVLEQDKSDSDYKNASSLFNQADILPKLNEMPELVEEKQPAKGAENNIFEKYIEKATENKRIQYTVLPPVEIFKEDQNSPASINERLAKLNQSQSIDPKIDNLKTAITLNKKIAFVNDLFKENVVEYAKAIDKLNNAASLEEALSYLAEYKRTYNWEATNQLVNDLEGLIKRRFK